MNYMGKSEEMGLDEHGGYLKSATPYPSIPSPRKRRGREAAHA